MNIEGKSVQAAFAAAYTQTSYYNNIIIKDEDEDDVVLGTGDYIVFGVKVSPNDSSSSCIITNIITESAEDDCSLLN